MTSEIMKAAQDEKVRTKLLMLSKEPVRVYEILEKISNIVKRKDFNALMQLTNYELFFVYFCCNNDSMSLIYEGKYNFFDEPITYEELYSIIDESQQYIDAWTMNDYYKIRKLIDSKNNTELITTTQTLGLSPHIIGHDFTQPVISILNFIYFKDEYIAHIVDKKCPAGVCKDLLQYKINADKCKGCTLCARKCPVGAISGNVKEPHVIDTAKCVKCGACVPTCKFKAISKQ